MQDVEVKIYVLYVSYPSAIEFSGILFLLFARSSSNSPWSFQRLRRTLGRNFNWNRQQMKNFPIYSIVKIARFRQRYNLTESGQFLQWGSMGNLFTWCRIWMKFGPRVRLKRWNDQREFKLDRAKSKNNIAENSVVLGHETHNRSIYMCYLKEMKTVKMCIRQNKFSVKGNFLKRS